MSTVHRVEERELVLPITEGYKNPSASRCNVCRCIAVREHVPWNRDWRCNGDHKRCTMVGCIPVLS